MKTYLGLMGGALVFSSLAVAYFIWRVPTRGALLNSIGRCFGALAVAGLIRVGAAGFGFDPNLASALAMTVTGVAVALCAWQLWRVNGVG